MTGAGSVPAPGEIARPFSLRVLDPPRLREHGRPVRIPIMRLGVGPSSDLAVARANLPIVCRALGYWLGTTVTPAYFDSHDDMVRALTQRKLELAWTPPIVAMDCDAAGVARPMLAMVRQDETSYYSVLFVRKESTIKSIADLVGVTAAWVGPQSAAGYLVSAATLRARGVFLSRAFANQRFLGSHPAVVRAVHAREADVGATFAHFESIESRTISSSGWTEAGFGDDFRILFVSGPIPTDTISVHRSLSSEHVRAVSAAFQWLTDRIEFEAARNLFACRAFQPCTASHLRGLRKLVKLLDRPSQVAGPSS